jgi:hypothetical protein
MTEHIIYGLIDPRDNELRYVGYTSDEKKRYKSHLSKSSLKENTHKNNWIKSLLALDLKPIMEVICDYETAEELPQREIQWIANMRILGNDLTNATDGGDGVMKGRKHSEETKKKISEAVLGEKNHNYGKKGKPMSEETKKKLLEAKLGKKHSEETKQKISEANKGKKHSEESKRKMSEAKLGKPNPMSEETKKKISEAHKGKKLK